VTAAKFLLDTNIVIYIRQKRPQSVLDRFQAMQRGEAAISLITYGELLYGAHKSSHHVRALAQLKELVQLLPVASLPEASADTYGIIRADLEKRGEVISNNDLWIAAHAHAAGLILVTNNEREFRRIKGLRIENWAESS
jgi:tRNA(fMet)-specific endonuclease VapC